MTTILTEVNGFTPVIDAIVTDLGGTPALVFGMVWRFCQMESGTCTASVETIASRLNMDRKTAERHIKKLCAAGYLEDTTPDRKHAPHIYRDTGKAQVVGSMQGKAKRPTTTVEVGQNAPPVGQNTPPRSGELHHLGRTKCTSKIPYKIPLEDTHEDIILDVSPKIREIQSLTVDAIKRKKLKASEWEQLLAFEESQQKPRKGLISFINKKLANGHITPELRQFLDLFNAQRFANPTQTKAVSDCIQEHGLELVLAAGEWAAKKPFSLGDAIIRLPKTIETWKRNEQQVTNASATGGRVFT